MLTLYHGGTSVCSIKARLVMEETGLPWESVELDLVRGDQLEPDYLKLNPAGVVPTLVDDGRVLVESSIIIDYLAQIADPPSLIPADPFLASKARLWALRTLAYHDAANTVTFAAYNRRPMLKLTPEEREARYAKMPDPMAAEKRRDLVENGPKSRRVEAALGVYDTMCATIEADLAGQDWLLGDAYSLADAAVAAFVFRLECLGLDGMWTASRPRMTDWWRRLKARPAFERAVAPYLDAAKLADIAEAGRTEIADDPRFSRYFGG